ncbi:MAG: aminotransferase class V-fold PLP-dependent enzyme, partial [Actinobacteria bacterium]
MVQRLLAVEKGLRLLRIAVTAPDEHAGRDLADAEPLGEDTRLPVRARTDRPSALLHRRITVRRRSDGGVHRVRWLLLLYSALVTDPAQLRHEFLLDPDVVFLNHGSYGACPRPVFERYQEWQLELERRPVEFLGRRLDTLLAEARAAFGEYVNADPDDLVFVQNATAGVNLAARAVAFQPGDEVLSTSLEYGALDLAWTHVCGRAWARYVRMPVTLPLRDAVDEIWNGVSERTRVLFLSHVTSETAVQLPIEELCARARERGITTVIDGAHVPGHIPLDLRALDVDYYAGNCHKWLCAPKGAGFLYVRRDLQATIAPLVISWGYEGEATFLARHEKQGTRDPAA